MAARKLLIRAAYALTTLATLAMVLGSSKKLH
jgi:hypothetical protein